MDLVDRLGLKILVMHYPPCCSKFNPIEHRLFSQITRSWCGAPLLSVANACRRAAKTVTKTGLKVIATVVDKVYQTKGKVSESFQERLAKQVVFGETLHKWNYVMFPFSFVSSYFLIVTNDETSISLQNISYCLDMLHQGLKIASIHFVDTFLHCHNTIFLSK